MDDLRIRVEFQRADQADVVYVIGELNYKNSDRLIELLGPPGPDGRSLLVLDVSACDVDAFGATTLADLPDMTGERVRLVTRDPFVRSVIHAVGLDGSLPIYPTVADALLHAVL